jgi:hypothetical protein
MSTSPQEPLNDDDITTGPGQSTDPSGASQGSTHGPEDSADADGADGTDAPAAPAADSDGTDA